MILRANSEVTSANRSVPFIADAHSGCRQLRVHTQSAAVCWSSTAFSLLSAALYLKEKTYCRNPLHSKTKTAILLLQNGRFPINGGYYRISRLPISSNFDPLIVDPDFAFYPIADFGDEIAHSGRMVARHK